MSKAAEKAYKAKVAASKNPRMWKRWEQLTPEVQGLHEPKKQAKIKAAPAPKAKKKAAKKK